MRFALCAALLTIASVPGIAAATGESQLLLGNIDYGYEPPYIAGPHRLFMVAGMGNDHMRVDTSSAEAQRWLDYAGRAPSSMPTRSSRSVKRPRSIPPVHYASASGARPTPGVPPSTTWWTARTPRLP